MQALQQFGPFALLVILLLDSMGIPLPTEISLLVAGGLLRQGRFGLITTIAASVVGFSLGSWFSYRLGASVGARLLGKYGRYVGIKPEHLEKAENWVRKHGARAVLIGRFIPIVRNLAGYPAGAVGMQPVRYWAATLLGYSGYVAMNLALGYYVGHHWKRLLHDADEWLWLLGLIGGLYLAFRLWRYVRRRNQQQQQDPPV